MGINLKLGKEGGSGPIPISGSTGKIELKRNLKVTNCISLLIAIIIGSGIFISPKGVVQETGSVGYALIIWVACGVVSIFGAFAYAELGCMIPRAGGEYEYIMAAFGNVWAFLFIWAFVIIVMPASFCFTALVFAQYALEPFYVGCEAPNLARVCIAAAIILLVTFVNCTSLKSVQILSHSANLGKVVGLFSIIGLGIFGLVQGNTENLTDPFKGTEKNILNGVNAFYSGIFSYSGWNYLSYVVEEIVEPNRTLPLSIGIGLMIVIVIYLFANVSYFVLLAPREMIKSNAVAFSFVEKVIGEYSWVMSIFVCLSCLGYINGGFLSASRTIFGAARKNHMPKFLAFINIKFLTPITSILFLSFISLLLLCFFNKPDDVYNLLDMTVLSEYIFIMITVVGLLWLRKTQANAERPFKSNLVFPIAFLIICTFVIIVSCYKKTYYSMLCISVILCGLPIYYLFIVLEKPPSMKKKIQKFDMFVQKLTFSVLDESAE